MKTPNTTIRKSKWSPFDTILVIKPENFHKVTSQGNGRIQATFLYDEYSGSHIEQRSTTAHMIFRSDGLYHYQDKSIVSHHFAMSASKLGIK